MKWYAETTEWSDNTRNGIYLLNDSKSKMYAFLPAGVSDIKVFQAPIKIDIRGRKFKLNDVQFKTTVKEQEPQGRSWTVKGSRGDEYRVTESGGNFNCTCSGFRFRGQCKHVESIRQTV
jgi:hypothetical protein